MTWPSLMPVSAQGVSDHESWFWPWRWPWQAQGPTPSQAIQDCYTVAIEIKYQGRPQVYVAMWLGPFSKMTMMLVGFLSNFINRSHSFYCCSDQIQGRKLHLNFSQVSVRTSSQEFRTPVEPATRDFLRNI